VCIIKGHRQDDGARRREEEEGGLPNEGKLDLWLAIFFVPPPSFHPF
jgi:hypothetical protein